MIALIAAAGIGVTLVLALVRLSAGPTLYDRALAVNAVVLRAALASAALAAAFGRSAWVDAALALTFAALLLSAAVLRFFRARSFQPSLVREDG